MSAPIDRSKKPDLSPIGKASCKLGRVISKSDIVIYVSKVYPDASDELCMHVIEEEAGLVSNKDFYAGYDPECMNTRGKQHVVAAILKLTSGALPEAPDFVDIFYRQINTAGAHMASTNSEKDIAA